MEFVMIKELNSNSTHIGKIKDIYFHAFPAEERIEFEDILNLKFPNSKIFGIFEKDCLVGFSYVSLLGNFAYIVYLAIEESERNKYYGTKAVSELVKLYKDKTKVLCVEKPIVNNDLKHRRINFYLRNGFNLANFQFDYLGQSYLAMHNGKFNEKQFVNFLLTCFPGCNNFKKLNN